MPIHIATPRLIQPRHLDGIIPADMLVRIAQLNPNMAARMLKSMQATVKLYKGSNARKNQLHRFIDKMVVAAGEANKNRFVYDAQNKDTRPGVLLRQEGDAPVADKVANDCFDFHGIISDFYRIWHKRNSIDGNGMALKGIIHYLIDYMNAFWDGQFMTYGDGDKIIFLTFMLLNIAAHEMTHGVTEHAVPGGIEYYGQPGATNEHFSDVGGANVESWHLKLTASKYHFLVGKGIFVPAAPGSKDILNGLRDMRRPGNGYWSEKIGKDPQPGHMKDYVKTSSDNGGVHINSGILNGVYADVCDGLEAANIGGDWESTIGNAALIWYAARPDVGNRPSFSKVAYHCIEACAVIRGLEEQCRKVVSAAFAGRGITPDKKAIDELTPARSPDDIELGETA